MKKLMALLLMMAMMCMAFAGCSALNKDTEPANVDTVATAEAVITAEPEATGENSTDLQTDDDAAPEEGTDDTANN